MAAACCSISARLAGMSPSAMRKSPISARDQCGGIGPARRVRAVDQHAAGLADGARPIARAGAVGRANIERHAGDHLSRRPLSWRATPRKLGGRRRSADRSHGRRGPSEKSARQARRRVPDAAWPLAGYRQARAIRPRPRPPPDRTSGSCAGPFPAISRADARRRTGRPTPRKSRACACCGAFRIGSNQPANRR